MERHLRREANHAHRQEVRAERREDRLHDRAVNAALHGNLGKAIHLESKANASHHRAEAAHAREVNARVAANSMHHHHHPPPPFHPHPPHHHHHVPRPPPVVVHHHHHPPPPPHQHHHQHHPGYPTGPQAYPPRPGHHGYPH